MFCPPRHPLAPVGTSDGGLPGDRGYCSGTAVSGRNLYCLHQTQPGKLPTGPCSIDSAGVLKGPTVPKGEADNLVLPVFELFNILFDLISHIFGCLICAVPGHFVQAFQILYQVQHVRFTPRLIPDASHLLAGCDECPGNHDQCKPKRRRLSGSNKSSSHGRSSPHIRQVEWSAAKAAYRVPCVTE